MIKNDIIAVIPARLNSLRLPGKLLLKVKKFTILEHVINRLMLSGVFSKIIIASPDYKIKKTVKKYKNILFFKSKKKHFSGTSRSLEAIKNIRFSKAVVLFADEPLILPSEIKFFVNKINRDLHSNIWNATVKITNNREFQDKSIVKCILDKNSNIINLTRLCRLENLSNKLKRNIVKSVGLIAFSSNVVKKISSLKKTNNERIEQLNFLNKKKLSLKSIILKHNFFSINNHNDFNKIKKTFTLNHIQKKIIKMYA